MRIPKQTLTIVLESPDGNAVLEFDRLRYPLYERVISAMDAVPRDESGGIKDESAFNRAFRESRKALFGTCIKVTGLENPDGSPVTPEQVAAQDLYSDVLGQILTGLQAAIAKGGAAEKNEPSPGEPSSD